MNRVEQGGWSLTLRSLHSVKRSSFHCQTENQAFFFFLSLSLIKGKRHSSQSLSKMFLFLVFKPSTQSDMSPLLIIYWSKHHHLILLGGQMQEEPERHLCLQTNICWLTNIQFPFLLTYAYTFTSLW